MSSNDPIHFEHFPFFGERHIVRSSALSVRLPRDVQYCTVVRRVAGCSTAAR